MPLHKDSVPKTAFTLPGLRQFEWLTSPMGVIRCPASFQTLMVKMMESLKNVKGYFDDLLMHSKMHEEHLEKLDTELQILADNNRKIYLAK